MSTKKARKRIPLTPSNLILFTGLIFLLVPTLMVGYILLESTLETGTVIRGNRFSNDLNPAIDENLVSLVREALSTTEDVRLIELNLRAATLRVTLEVASDLNASAQAQLAATIVSTVDSVLPLETFFTSTDSRKMYDLEVLAYDTLTEPSTFFKITKNALMEAYVLQDLLQPQNPSLVERIQQDREARLNPIIPGGQGEESDDDDNN
jgi:hypothetical protein